MPHGLPFKVQKLGHAVVNVSDLERSKRFYTEVLGFKVSDVYGPDKMPGGMVFLRSNGDHHSLALVGGAPAADKAARTLHHLAFELATLDEVFRPADHLTAHDANVVSEGPRLAPRRPHPQTEPPRPPPAPRTLREAGTAARQDGGAGHPGRPFAGRRHHQPARRGAPSQAQGRRL
ncbi:MAG: VOC family protein, partial [Reyranella sp.]|nr:VOC family protein [Reyranella sp.]